MGVRLLDERQPTNVIPLRRKDLAADVATAPEPTRLYHLIILAFLLHTPASDGCQCCGKTWPCRQVRLAFRLREGF